MDDKLARNKKNAMAFYDLMFNQSKPREAMERYAGARYIQHNPHVGDGKEPFIAYFERMAREYPGKRVEFRRAIANPEWAGIDIFRLDDDGKVVEHWDVLQVVPPKSANSNGVF